MQRRALTGIFNRDRSVREMIQLDQIKIDLPEVKAKLKEVGESL